MERHTRENPVWGREKFQEKIEGQKNRISVVSESLKKKGRSLSALSESSALGAEMVPGASSRSQN